MSFENVDIVVLDTTPDKDPIPGVLVKVYSKDGKTFFTQAETDVLGNAAFLLNTQEYQIRFYKQHVSLPNPLYIEVLPSPEINIFDVSGELVAPPTANDGRLCVAFGYFRRPDGSPASNVDIHFINKFNPLSLDGDAVLTERIAVRTDENGFAKINLIRFGKYDVTVQGQEDYQRCIAVPDLPNVSLPALLFPVVAKIVFSPVGPFNVPVGNEIQVTPTIYSSDGNVVDDPGEVQWSSSNPNVLAVLPAGGVLTLRGLAAGTANIQAVRADNSIVRIPDPGITGVPAAVTVA